MFLLAFAAVYVGQVVAILLHELGHALMALACGWKADFIEVGRDASLFKFRIGELGFSFRILPTRGYARFCPQDFRHVRLKWALSLVAGPLITAGIVWILWQNFQRIGTEAEWLGIGLACLLFLQAVTLLNSLIPQRFNFDQKPMASDMLQLWWALKSSKVQLRGFGEGMVLSVASHLFSRGKVDRARELLEKVCSTVPVENAVSIKVRWIYVLLVSGKKAEAELEKSALLEISKSSEDARIHVLDGLACIPLYYGFSEMLAEAVGYIDMAIEEAPELITLKGTKSSLLIELGQVDAGLSLLEEVASSTQSENDRAIVSFYRVLAYLKKGDRTKARHLLREANERYAQCVVKQRIESIFWSEDPGLQRAAAVS